MKKTSPILDEDNASEVLAKFLVKAMNGNDDHPEIEKIKMAYSAVLSGQSCVQINDSFKDKKIFGLATDEKNIPDTPLIYRKYDGSQLLYLRRMDELEKLLAEKLQKKSTTPVSKSFKLTEVLDLLKNEGLKEKQKDGIAKLGEKCFFIITGGPGTGKTFLMKNLLRVAIEIQKINPSEIRLVAPTGRAARRIAESIKPDRDNGHLQGVSEPQTIHSLLYQSDVFETLKLLVVDESSMVDLMLFYQVVEKLPDDCILVLVGDPNQLPSVEVGSVLADLCEAEKLKDNKVTLTEQMRSKENSGIMEMANLVLNNLSIETIEVTEPKFDDIFNSVKSEFEEIKKLAEAGKVDEAVAAIDKARILCSQRLGDFGSQVLSKSIAEKLGIKFNKDGDGGLYLVTKNDRNGTGLTNGDVGVMVDGLVHFRGHPAGFDLSRLPEYEPAFATTIHKSQGSEYDKAVVVISETERTDFLNRQLIYTAITRAKKEVKIFSLPDTFKQACTRDVPRASGLKERLS
jgi:exodeoxyribonuclease V alpha subunit